MQKNLYFDLTVAGAGIAGIIASIAAARNGLRVALINDRPVPGGNASSEIGVGLAGSSNGGLNTGVYTKEGGLVEELRQNLRMFQSGGGYSKNAIDATIYTMLDYEPNIELFSNTVVRNCKVDNGRITELYAFQLKSEIEVSFISPLYIDSTGDGVLAFHAGAEYRMGEEAKSEFNEKWAPDIATPYTMGHTLIFYTKDAGHPVKFKAPTIAHDISNMDFMKDPNRIKHWRELSPYGSSWSYEYGGQVNTILDSEHINDELRALSYGIWNYVKNSGMYPEAENRMLERVLSMPGSRESRRIIGDYILTENDIENKVKFEDAVCMGGWPMDVHAPFGIYDKRPASNFIPVTGTYNIPLRCLYSKNISNLMLAGRDISVTHIALGSTRVMASCGCQGHAVGTAAVLCKKYGISPREVCRTHIDELQGLLKYYDQSIIGMCDSLNPEIEAHFTATATSTLSFENTEYIGVQPLEHAYGLSLPLTSDYIDSLSIKIRNSSPEETKLIIDVLEGSCKESYLPERLVKSLEYPIPGYFDSWMPIEVNTVRGRDDKVHMVLRPNQHISIYYTDTHVQGAVTKRYYIDKSEGMDHDSAPLNHATGYIGCDHRKDKLESFLGPDNTGQPSGYRHPQYMNIVFKDIYPEQNTFSPTNVLNGYSRPYGRQNIWYSAQAGEQTLSLISDIPQNIEEVHFIFDTSLESDHPNYPQSYLVKDYVLTVKCEDGSMSSEEVGDNYLRLRRHKISKEKVTEINLTIRSNRGGKYHGIYAVKLI